MKKGLILLTILITSIALNAYLYDSVYDLERRAQSGDVQSQFTLGLKYGNGDGVTRNDGTAYFWVLISVAFGHEDEYGILTMMAMKLTSVGRSQVQNRAIEWIRNSSNYYNSDKTAAINWIKNHGANLEYMIQLLELE